MKFSENWLRERLPGLKAERAELLETLTMSGLEVEGFEALAAPPAGVIVGEIVACEQHPNADRLRVCQVATGRELLQIVCGAPNARVGLKAPLATIGTVLDGPGIEIKAATLRGVASAGMLCSAAELGLHADTAGLLELPAAAEVGQPLASVLGLPDAIIELGLTPNRADCLGMDGLAREVAAQWSLPHTDSNTADADVVHQQQPTIVVDAGDACPNYLGRYLVDVDAGAATPIFIAERLRRAGLRPVSVLVDITNYVMLETGQPLHAFDADAIDGAVCVRLAQRGEQIDLLDGRTVVLDGTQLLIADQGGAIALAGIMGGRRTQVHAATRRVLLEAAHFAPSAISGRARKLGLHTDASHRFERGVDQAAPRRALERASALAAQWAGAQCGPVVAVEQPASRAVAAPITLRQARLYRVLGYAIDPAQVGDILSKLGCAVERSADGWRATPPSARFDLAIEEDLIEEVARIYGYGHIPTAAPRGELRVRGASDQQLDVRQLRERLVARGASEALNLAFGDPAHYARFGDQPALLLSNPLSAELAQMRPALLPGLLRNVAYNQHRQQARVRLFEVGRVFLPGNAGDALQEVERLAFVHAGALAPEQWAERSRAFDFYDLRAELEALLALRGANASHRIEPLDSEHYRWLHPGQSAQLRINESVAGVLGAMHPQLLKQYGIDGPVLGFELDLAPLLRRPPLAATLPPRMPSVRRDLAFVVARSISAARIEEAVRRAAGALLSEFLWFDVYTDEKLGANQRSIAMGLIFQEPSRTLTDSEVDEGVLRVVRALSDEFGATQRV